jgi:cyclopropane-fatty-acyl-phospholipid synthase
MFEAFLSRDMTYSCAIFPALDADLSRSTKGERLLANGVVVRGLGNGDMHLIDSEHDNLKVAPLSDEEDELYQAQMIKLQHLVKKLKIPEKSGVYKFETWRIHLLILLLMYFKDKTIRVLEIGSGWGALAILLTQTYPFVEVDSITLSSDQVRISTFFRSGI